MVNMTPPSSTLSRCEGQPAQGAGQTRVEIIHRGWERLGQAAGPWRDRNQAAWQTLLPHYLTAITEGGT
jgi:hypothetical protein